MKKEKDNGIELPEKPGLNETVNGQPKNKEKLTFSQQTVKFINNLPYYIKKFFAFFTVEPFLLCFVLPNIISALAVQKLNLEKACRVDLNYTEEICNNVIAGIADDNITITALNEASVMNADMTAWKQPLQSGIPAILILFVGAWSDRTGNRKALMLIPLIGELITAIGLVLATYFFLEWPLWVTALIEGLPPAFCGGLSIALMGSYSYMADVTTLENRTFRIGIVAVIVTLSIPIGSAISGVLTEAIGYYGIFGSNILLFIIGFIHTYFRVHDIKKVETEGTFLEKLKLFFHPSNVWDTISLVVKARGRQLIQVLLVIWAHIVIIGPVFGEGANLYFYTLKKYNMDIVDFSFFATYSAVMGLIGTMIAVTVFSKLLKFHDSVLGIIATTCKVISSFVYALAPTRDWFYSGPAFDIFGNSGVTAIRSLGTKIVEPDEVGKMCSLIGFVEAVVPVIYTPIYSKIYSNTLEDFPGMFYIVGGLMTIPDFFIFMTPKYTYIDVSVLVGVFRVVLLGSSLNTLFHYSGHIKRIIEFATKLLTTDTWFSFACIFIYYRTLYIFYKKQQRDLVKNPDAKEMYAHENAVTAL